VYLEDSGSVYAVDISPDGQLLVNGSMALLMEPEHGEWLYSLFNKVLSGRLISQSFSVLMENSCK